MLQKIIDWESLKVFQRNFYNGVSFSKVTSLQFSDCNFTIKRTHHRFLLEYVLKTSCLKKYILRKNSVVDQHLDKFAALQYTTLIFIKKAELMKDLPVEAVNVLIYSQVNLLVGSLFLLKLQV